MRRIKVEVCTGNAPNARRTFGSVAAAKKAADKMLKAGKGGKLRIKITG